jgi:N-acetylglutamate synthase-like GNAT family acetyltransferase
MPESALSSQPSEFILRPADRQDSQSLLRLTHQLYETALPRSHWHQWILLGVASCAIAFMWHYPQLFVMVIISTAPLWLMILLVFFVARQEQQQQWEQYWVIEYQATIVACARLDIHTEHREIYDLFVLPQWRGHGCGRQLMQHLIATSNQPIYLASLPSAVAFYQTIGFRPIAIQKLPMFLSGRLSLNSPRYRRIGLQPMIWTSPS